MDPYSIAYVVIAAISAIVGASSAISSSQQQRKIFEYNAQLAEQQAKEKRAQAAYQADRLTEQNEELKARQRLAFNVAGVTPEGSPSDLLMDTTRKMELDALAIRYGGESSGSSLEAQSRIARMQGSGAESAGWWNAGSSLLSSGTSVMKTYGYKENKVIE
jgi:hypothetical protein